MIAVISNFEMSAESNTEMACPTRLHGHCMEQVKRNTCQSRRMRYLSVVLQYLSQTLLPDIKLPKRTS
jgi:hypothetical protein